MALFAVLPPAPARCTEGGEPQLLEDVRWVRGLPTAVSFDRDGSRLAIATSDLTVTIWETADWTRVETYRDASLSGLLDLDLIIESVALGLGRDQVVIHLVPTDESISAADFDINEELFRTWDPERGAFVASDFFGDAGSLFVDELGDVSVFEGMGECFEFQSFPVPLAKLSDCIDDLEAAGAAGFDPNAGLVALGTEDGGVIGWSLYDRRELVRVDAFEELPLVLGVHGDQEILAAATRTSLGAFDLESGRPLGSAPLTFAPILLRFAPDGSRILIVGVDGRMELRHPRSGRRLEVLVEGVRAEKSTDRPVLVPQYRHTGGVSALAYSPDGRWLASASGMGQVKIWDRSTDLLYRSLTPAQFGWEKTVSVSDLTFDTTGRELYISYEPGPYEHATVAVDVRSGAPVRRFQEGEAQIAVLEDGSAVGYSTSGGDYEGKISNRITFTDLETGEYLNPELADNWYPVSAERFFDFDVPGRARLELPGILTAAFLARDGRRIAVVDDSSLPARILDRYTGELLRLTVPGPRNSRAVALSEDGSRIAIAGEGIVVGDIDGRELLRDEHVSYQGALAVSPDGAEIAFSSRRGLDRIDLDTGGSPALMGIAPRRGLLAAAFSADGRWLALRRPDLTEIWDLSLGTLRHTIPGRGSGHWHWSPDRISHVAFTRDGRALVRHSAEGLGVYDTSLGSPVLQLAPGDDGAAPPDAARARRGGAFQPGFRIHPDGERLLTLEDGTLRVRAIDDGRILTEIPPPRFGELICRPADIAIDPSAPHRIAVAGETAVHGCLSLWTLGETPVRTRSTLAFHEPISRVFFAEGGSSVVTVHRNRLKRWDAKDLAVIEEELFHRGLIALPHPDGQRMVTGADDGDIVVWDLATSAPVERFTAHDGSVEVIALSPDGALLLTHGSEGITRLWRIDPTTKLLDLVSTGATGYLWATSEGYYMGSRAGLRAVAFRYGDSVLPLEQFDLLMDRPDEVLQALGVASEETVRAYHDAWVRRVARAGIAPGGEIVSRSLPTVEVDAPTDSGVVHERDISLTVRARDPRFPLASLHVQVNGVPVRGREGIQLVGRRHTATRNVPIRLSAGANRVEVFARNRRGVESFRGTMEFNLELPDTPRHLYLATVGVSDYDTDLHDLEHSDDDASAIATFFETTPGRFDQVHVQPLLDRDATRASILALRDFFAQATEDDVVMLFLAGHGLLDRQDEYYFATSGTPSATPADGGVAYREIADLMDGIASRQRLILMDTCHAGEILEGSPPGAGGTATSAEPEGRSGRGARVAGSAARDVGTTELRAIQDQFVRLGEDTGTTIISASGGEQSAWESGTWGHGAFTLALLEGLEGRADLDSDGRVMLSEIQQQVPRRVEELTGGLQLPMTRLDNVDLEFCLRELRDRR